MDRGRSGRQEPAEGVIGLTGKSQMGAEDQISAGIGHDRAVGPLHPASFIHAINVRSVESPGDAGGHHGPVKTDE